MFMKTCCTKIVELSIITPARQMNIGYQVQKDINGHIKMDS